MSEIPKLSSQTELFYFKFKLSIQSVISEADAEERNRIPSFHTPLPAFAAKFLALFPSGEEADVANGITVLPVKSLFFTKSSNTQLASDHHIG